MTPDQGFMASRAPAWRVAFSTKRKAMDLPSGDQAGCWMSPVRWRELLGVAGGFGPEEDLLLVGLGFVAGAGGEEGEGLAVGGPDGVPTEQLGGVVDLDDLCGGGIGDVGEMEGGAFAATERPGHGRAVGRDGDAAGLGCAGELLVGIGGVWRGGESGLGGSFVR